MSSAAFRSRSLHRPSSLYQPTVIDTGRRLSEALLRAGRSDRAGMEEVYRLTRGRLLSVCQTIARDRSVAEEVLQDVYLAVWRVAGQFDPSRGTAMAWLMTVARNRSLDRQRRTTGFGRQATILLDEVADPCPTAETMLVLAETEALVHSTLKKIEPRAQHLIREAFFNGFTYAELARREGVPLPTMKSLIRRTLAKMRAEMTSPG